MPSKILKISSRYAGELEQLIANLSFDAEHYSQDGSVNADPLDGAGILELLRKAALKNARNKYGLDDIDTYGYVEVPFGLDAEIVVTAADLDVYLKSEGQ